MLCVRKHFVKSPTSLVICSAWLYLYNMSSNYVSARQVLPNLCVRTIWSACSRYKTPCVVWYLRGSCYYWSFVTHLNIWFVWVCLLVNYLTLFKLLMTVLLNVKNFQCNLRTNTKWGIRNTLYWPRCNFFSCSTAEEVTHDIDATGLPAIVTNQFDDEPKSYLFFCSIFSQSIPILLPHFLHKTSLCIALGAFNFSTVTNMGRETFFPHMKAFHERENGHHSLHVREVWASIHYSFFMFV